MGVCGTCGSPWVRTTSDFWGCSRFRYGGPCTNNRLINNKGYQERVLTELKNGMLAPEVVSAYVREYHRDFARASADLGRDRGRIERKLDEAERRKTRLLKAFADGGSEFDEIRDMLTNARRSEERRVGKACVSTCRYRGSRCPETKHK